MKLNETVSRGLRTTSIAAALALSAVFLLVTSARAGDFKILSFDNSALTASGATDTQAAGHPYELTTDMEFPLKTVEDASGPITAPVENLKRAQVDFPVGFSGDPSSVPRCPQARLDLGTCPPETQVGTVETRSVSTMPTITTPLYNLAPPPGEPAQFGFSPALFPIRIGIKVRTGSDYGITATVEDIAQPVAITGSKVTLWGVPADPRHDAERSQLCQYYPSFEFNFCNDLNGGPGPVHQDPKPFLTNPSDCDAGPLATKVTVSSWQHPDELSSANSVSHLQGGADVGVDSCDKLEFKPKLIAKPASLTAGAPGGWAIDLDVPQNENPTGLATPPLKKVSVAFPRGVTVSPSSADGLGACSPAQVALSSEGDANCPESSKIGTVTVETPVLEDPLVGSVYLATQNDNPFNSLIALYIVAKGSGVVVKLPGRIDLDAETGQVIGTFDNNPQLPFSHLRMELKGGSRAALTSPKNCGTYTTHAELTSWASHTPIPSDSSFTIDRGCDNVSRFEPTMDGGLTNPKAGTSSAFVLNFGRPDGQQDLGAVKVALPPGLLADIGSVPLCPEAQAAAGTCPAGSQIGNTSVESGPGSTPLGIPQVGKAPTRVYLAGPYKGAPYSLSIVVPAQAGPFDLGSVVVRSSLAIDALDAHATVTSDRLPTMLQGIPLNIQRVHVTVGRPGFMVTPTSCDPMQISGAVFSAQGAVGQVSSRFQVRECASLGFKPKLALNLSGGTRRADFPALRAQLTMPTGGANIAATSVALPHSEFLAQSHIRTVCTRVQFNAGQGNGASCPKGSIYGKATATTPLLKSPLSGPVYLRSSDNPLPDLVVALHGQIDIDLVGRIDSSKGGIRATFDSVPDAPVSKFVLSMQGAKKGLLENSRDICASTNRVAVTYTAHNGDSYRVAPQLKAKGCKGGKAKKKNKARGKQGR